MLKKYDTSPNQQQDLLPLVIAIYKEGATGTDTSNSVGGGGSQRSGCDMNFGGWIPSNLMYDGLTVSLYSLGYVCQQKNSYW